MNNLILGCADSLIAHSIYADFLEDFGKDTRFFRLFLQMRRNPDYFQEVYYGFSRGETLMDETGDSWFDGFGAGSFSGYGMGFAGKVNGNGEVFSLC